MKIKIFYLSLAVLCGTVLIPATLFAQEEDSAVGKIAEVEALGSMEWQKTVDDAKDEIKKLLQENERLTSEYDFLKEKLSSLQSKVLEVKQDVEERRRAGKSLEQFQKDQLDVRAKIKTDIETAQREIADIEKEKELLVKELKDEEKRTEAWQAKMSDLQAKKRELTLELKLQEISRQQLEKGQDEDLERVKEDLAKSQEEEKSLEKELRALQKEVKDISPETDKVVLNNKELELKIGQLKTQHEEQVRVNTELEKKNDGLKLQAEKAPADLVKEKDALDAEIRKLENELEAVKKSIEASAELVQQKRQMMNEIMRMDSENQELRTKIEALMEETADSER